MKSPDSAMKSPDSATKSPDSNESSAESPPIQALPPGRRRVIVALLALALVLGALAGWGWLRAGTPVQSRGTDQALTSLPGPSTGLQAVPVVSASATGGPGDDNGG